MKGKIIFFIVWFILIGGINTSTLLSFSKREEHMGYIEDYGFYSFLVLAIPFILYGVMEWSKERLDAYQKTMTVLLIIAIAILALKFISIIVFH